MNEKKKQNTHTHKLCLAEDKFMPEIHLRQLGFTYSACGLVNKKYKNLKKQELIKTN